MQHNRSGPAGLWLHGTLLGMALLSGCIQSLDVRLNNQTPHRMILWQLHSTGNLQRIGTAEPNRETLFPRAFSLSEQRYVFIITDEHEKVIGEISRASDELHREAGNRNSIRLTLNRDLAANPAYQGKQARELMKVGTHEIRPLRR